MSYLILHKVRGEPAFDIADKLDCPVCESARQGLDHGRDYAGNCNSCEDGIWWIIPTSGHRAYPYWSIPLDEIVFGLDAVEVSYDGHKWKDITDVPPLPPDFPDHYPMDVGEAPKPSFNIMAMISPMMRKFKRRL